MPSTIMTSAQEVVRAYYDAFNQGNLQTMMGLWAEDEDIICAHPGSAPLVGFAAVRASYESVFRNGQGMRVVIQDEVWHSTIGMTTQTCIEWVRVGTEPQPRGPVAVTNVMLRTPLGWRLLVHHAGPVAGNPNGGRQPVLH